MPADWPATSDLSAALTRAGITVPSSGVLTSLLAGAVAELERETGWLPFKAASATRYFDPPGSPGNVTGSPRGGERMLRLDGGLVSVTSLTVSSVAKVSGTDYWLRPNNALARGWPYTLVEFLKPIYGAPQCIAINGSWGFGSAIPDDAWWAVLELAEQVVQTEIKEGRLSDIVSWDEADVKERYGELTLRSAGDAFMASWKRRLARLKRVQVGV